MAQINLEEANRILYERRQAENQPAAGRGGNCLALDSWASNLLSKLTAVDPPSPSAAVPPCDVTLSLPSDAQLSSAKQLAKTIKLYPGIGLAAMQENEAPFLRLWLVMRIFDPMGAGKCDLPALKAFLSGKSSKLAGLGWENVRKLLRKGNGRYWHLETRNGKPHYQGFALITGHAKTAALLGVKWLTGKPVEIPISNLRTIGTLKAALYNAWHSGRHKPKPVSRQRQRQLTGIPERTQRHYCKVAGIKRQVNIAIGDRYNQESAQQAAWQHPGAFEFYDYQGRQGKPQSAYTAWHLPTSHEGTLTQAAYGSQRKINRYLVDLAEKGRSESEIAGERLEKVDKVFFDDAKQAGHVYNKRPRLDAYWPERHKSGERLTFWRVLPGVK